MLDCLVRKRSTAWCASAYDVLFNALRLMTRSEPAPVEQARYKHLKQEQESDLPWSPWRRECILRAIPHHWNIISLYHKKYRSLSHDAMITRLCRPNHKQRQGSLITRQSTADWPACAVQQLQNTAEACLKEEGAFETSTKVSFPMHSHTAMQPCSLPTQLKACACAW